ncbi:hypothetical protein J2Z22_000262 [Paenibacillus forsythiae]|uniref:Uncharacterized protein n=1 Tax=Paenibacillus forsythiae TaxID=365616 RepID=A0ABU3H1Q1_9BACL|nr:hypothetical protein [Paenibacillus forsythiae]MDT3424750.1 hypothetical protein [Paenibacillus forsythiae]
MKKGLFSFLLVVVLTLSFATAVFAENEKQTKSVHNSEETSLSINGQYQYGRLSVYWISGYSNVWASIEAYEQGSWKTVLTLVANGDKPKVTTNYYMEGGKSYRLHVYSPDNGVAAIQNYPEDDGPW